MALRQTCTVQVRARRIRYRRALQIAQNEEYLVGEDLSDIRRYGEDSAYVDSEYRVKRSMDQIKERILKRRKILLGKWTLQTNSTEANSSE